MPSTIEDLRDVIADAAASGQVIELLGGGSKRAIGLPDRETKEVPMSGLSGVIDYDPSELVLTLRAGTPLSEAQRLLADQGQMFGFDPFDHGPIFGRDGGGATVGGIVAAGVSGSRRLSAGGARDHLLGFRAVSGRGEIFQAGAKVVKNVTGYDVPKLMAGSWGQLAALAELTFKVLPVPEESASLVLIGLDDREAAMAMTQAMQSRCEVSAAAHLPGRADPRDARTLLRVEGFRPSVTARLAALQDMLGGEIVRDAEDARLWDALRTLAPLPSSGILWRINVPPSRGRQCVESLRSYAEDWLYDWAGGLIWLIAASPEALVREAAERAGGHAMLVRAPGEVRRRISAWHPEPPALAALSARVRRAFDPVSILDPQRFSAAGHAN